jgi:predicted DCC family thiol-disulfide oxidoreductase YuxK
MNKPNASDRSKAQSVNLTDVNHVNHVNHATRQCNDLTVMYDGACPLCRKEIGVYQSLTPLEPVQWLDVSAAQADISPEQQARYMARFHVRQKDGQLLSGAAAFVALWLTMPGWRWLGRFGRLPGMTPLMEIFYTGFLRIRPSIQKLFK